jgi:hypothetical protein
VKPRRIRAFRGEERSFINVSVVCRRKEEELRGVLAVVPRAADRSLPREPRLNPESAGRQCLTPCSAPAAGGTHVYRGHIVGVRTVGGDGTFVYDVVADGVTRVAPVDNVTIPPADGKCPDGQPE